MSVLGLNPLVALEVACGAPSCPGSLLTLWSIRSCSEAVSQTSPCGSFERFRQNCNRVRMTCLL